MSVHWITVSILDLRSDIDFQADEETDTVTNRRITETFNDYVFAGEDMVIELDTDTKAVRIIPLAEHKKWK